MGLQVRSLLLQQIIDGVGNGTGQVLTSGLGLSSYRVGTPNVKWGSFPMLTALGLTHHTYTSRVDSLTLTTTGPALPLAPDVDQREGGSPPHWCYKTDG